VASNLFYKSKITQHALTLLDQYLGTWDQSHPTTL
jgi:hypothetical protein